MDYADVYNGILFVYDDVANEVHEIDVSEASIMFANLLRRFESPAMVAAAKRPCA